MAREIINIGASPNDGQGDPIRTAFTKTNNNFSELYGRSQATPPTSLTGVLGDVAGMTAYDQEYYYYCFQDFDGSSVIWRQVPNAAVANVAVLSATGNITSDLYFIGNGSQLTGVVAAAPTSIVNGTTNVTTAENGNANISIGGTGNVAVFTTAGLDITGTASATGAITGASFTGAGTGLTGTAASLTVGTATTATSATTAGTVTTAAQPNITSVGTLTSVSVTGNVTSGNIISLGNIDATTDITAGGNVAGTFIIGDGGFLSNVTATGNVAVTQIQNGTTVLRIDGLGGNIIMDIDAQTNVFEFQKLGVEIDGNANITGNVNSSNAYINGRLIAVGNITGGNVTTGGLLVSTANVQGSNVNASLQMSAGGNITGGNIITGGVVSATGTISGGNISATGNVNAGNLITTNTLINAQVSTSGNVTGGNILTGGIVSATGNITGGNVIAVGIFSGPTANITGNVNASNVNATTLSATGNVNAANAYLTGRFLAIGNVTGGNVTSAGLIVTTGNVTGGNVVSTGAVSATGNITGGNLATGGAITGASVSVSGTVTGTSFVGVATSAQYADLAENYTADSDYEPGTVVEFGGSAEVTVAPDESKRIAGIVSTQPAHLMNSHLTGKHVVAVALIGRVPCKVRGTIRKGDMLVSAGSGFARAMEYPRIGTIIGKALQGSTGEGVIEVVVGRL